MSKLIVELKALALGDDAEDASSYDVVYKLTRLNLNLPNKSNPWKVSRR